MAVRRRPPRPARERQKGGDAGRLRASFRFFAEWWKQLYGESEGKEGKGLFPASLEYTADLHSMGQYIQEGQRLMCETVVDFAPKGEFLIPTTLRTLTA